MGKWFLVISVVIIIFVFVTVCMEEIRNKRETLQLSPDTIFENERGRLAQEFCKHERYTGGTYQPEKEIPAPLIETSMGSIPATYICTRDTSECTNTGVCRWIVLEKRYALNQVPEEWK